MGRLTLTGLQQNGDVGRQLPLMFAEPQTIRAAQYVRMSTEHQQYSTENQSDAVALYAARRGFAIVKTYADEGKSGLRLEGRDALRQMLDDVENGDTDFDVILVYDVSRWGRFQDADESAYYEMRCKRAGIRVEYCAEQFENDGSIASNIVKAVKRSMAGEYSRELSVKVFAGQCRLIELGFRQGGPAGFGLRRVLVDGAGNHKGELARGEQKSLQTDRVILVPGPEHETAVVEQIFRWFVEDRLVEAEIAERLNRQGIKTDIDRDWRAATVHQILVNEKYIGNNVFNKKSFKLKKRRVVNPPELWVRKEGAFEAIVAPELFYTARGMIVERSRKISNEEMLEKLRAVYQERGMLSGLIITETEGMPSPTAYSHRFGSLIRAYQLVGYTPERDYRYLEINKLLRTLHPAAVADAIDQITALGGSVAHDARTDLLTINDEFTASIVLARCQSSQAGTSRWNIRFDTGIKPDLTVAIRLNPDNTAAMDYYLLPQIDISGPRLRLAEDNGLFLDAYRFESLSYFFGMAKRVPVWRCA